MLKKIEENDITFIKSTSARETLDNFDLYFHTLSDDDLFVVFVCETLKILTLARHSVSQPTERKPEIINLIISYINANIQKPITMKTLVDEFHYSRSYISMEFKRHMSVSIMQYIRYKKIYAVHELILNGAKKQETAEKFGFETYSTFYRAYKKFEKSSSTYNVGAVTKL
jgi:YesN/AraC family two-component response regulator